MAALRIFSYLPNPRIWKATIAARLCGVEVEVRGASPGDLSQWLWDFDARPIADVPSDVLTAAERTGRIGFTDRKLYKTAAFLEAQPFGTVPAAFSPDGRTGIFESNSIMRTVARLGIERFPIYGRDVYESSRIDGFLDASLVFARDGQIYLFALRDGTVSRELHVRMRETFVSYLSGIEQALSPQRSFLVGDNITLADICFVAELCLFHNERARQSVLDAAGLSLLLNDEFAKPYPRSASHFRRSSPIRPSRQTSVVTLKRSRGARPGSNSVSSILNEHTEKATFWASIGALLMVACTSAWFSIGLS